LHHWFDEFMREVNFNSVIVSVVFDYHNIHLPSRAGVSLPSEMAHKYAHPRLL
jgi:hypothetical protein